VGTPCSGIEKLSPILKNGEFIDSYSHLFVNIYTERIALQDLKWEIASQIIKIQKNGLKINHINGHQHILMVHCLLKSILSLMKKHQIPFLRVPAEIVGISSLKSPKGWGFLILEILSKYWKLRLKFAGSPVRTATYFHGLSFSERMALQDLMGVLKSLKPGITEILCHPGYRDSISLPAHLQGPFLRERELRVLKSSEVINYLSFRKIVL